MWGGWNDITTCEDLGRLLFGTLGLKLGASGWERPQVIKTSEWRSAVLD